MSQVFYQYFLQNSVVDPERFDAAPDPTFQADADPEPDRNPKLF